MALKELGETTIPIIRLDSLTDEQRRAYGLVHNQLTMNSPWDLPALDLELADLDFDMSDFGFDDLSEENTPASNDRSVDFKERLQIIVECSSEDDMEDKFQRITELGIECRISTL